MDECYTEDLSRASGFGTKVCLPSLTYQPGISCYQEESMSVIEMKQDRLGASGATSKDRHDK